MEKHWKGGEGGWVLYLSDMWLAAIWKKKRPVFRRECNNTFSTGCGIRNVHFRHYEKTVGHFSTYHGRLSQRRHFLKSCFVLRILPYRCWSLFLRGFRNSDFGQVFIRPGLFSDPRAASQLVASVFAGRDVTAYARPRSISPHSQLEKKTSSNRGVM